MRDGVAMRRGVVLLVALLSAWGGAGTAMSPAPDPAASVPELIEVPAGRFLMGAGTDRDPDAFENERWSATAGEGEVDLPAFYIARTEITVAQFAAFVHATNRPVDPRALDAPATHPVAFVSWPDAVAVGSLMNTRGLVELIVLNLGLDLGILSPRIFAMLVVMALVTTMMTGPLLSAVDAWRRRAVQTTG